MHVHILYIKEILISSIALDLNRDVLCSLEVIPLLLSLLRERPFDSNVTLAIIVCLGILVDNNGNNTHLH